MNSKELEHDDQVRNDQHSGGIEFSHHAETPSDDPHGDRLVGVSIFPRANIITPSRQGPVEWHKVRGILMPRDARANKDGYLIGGYLTARERCDKDVKTRSLVQLDIDTKTKKNKKTGEVQIVKRAPPFADIRNHIDKYEYVAASSHSHDPGNGLIKYRVTLLPDRDIEPDEHEPLLEALDDLLGGNLDRLAWIWSQAFYLPSCPPDRVCDAFATHNPGALLPVDDFVEKGRQIIAAKGAAKGKLSAPAGTTSSATAGPRAPPPETAEEIARVQSMLDVIDADTDRQTWRQVCWAVLATRWDCAEKLIREWSERGEKFEETDFTKVVASFDPTGGTGFGTLVHHARQSGWQDPAEASATDRGLRDIANGRRFAERFRNKLLYLIDDESWLKFDPETGWRSADFVEADRAAKAIADEMRAGIKTKQQKAEVARSSQLRNYRAMIEAAKSEPGMSAKLADFDNDPMIIGLQNCIFDLDKGKHELPTPERKVSKRANVAYDPGADCPRFRKALKEVQPDKEVRRFLRVFMGYCLTGRIDEHVLIYFHGLGRNGKGTFIELMAYVLGDYASKIPTEMLMSQQRNSQAPSPDIMLLKGLRFAFANETKEGKQLDEAHVKDWTGGDTLIGRTPHAKAFISFSPTHKLMISGNYKPEVRDNSTGMWERVILVSFDVTIPEAKRDRRLGDTLKAEASGVLNWMLAGLADYQANGLKVPQKIKAATAAYRIDQDIIGEWIADNCVTSADLRDDKRSQYAKKLKEDKRSLYFDYANWARTSGYIPVAKKRLTRQLGERGYKLDPGKREITGIVLRTSRERIDNIPESVLKASSAASASVQSPDADDRKIVELKQPGKRRPSIAPGAPDRGGKGAPGVPDEGVVRAVAAPDEGDSDVDVDVDIDA